MSDQVIQDFMVRLGWKVDTDGEKKFDKALTTAVTKANLLARGIEEMATGIAKHIAAVVSNFDQLTYASARTGTAVGNLKSLQHGFSQVGGSAQQAMAVVESFTRTVRMNPGLRGFLKQLGIDQTKEGADQLIDVVKKLNEQPYHIAARQAEMLGIDESSFSLMTRQMKQFEAFRATYERTARAVGLDGKKAAEASTALSQAWGRLAGQASVVGDRFAADLMPHVTRFLNYLGDWVDRHSAEIGKFMDDLREYAGRLANGMADLGKALEPIGASFLSIAESLTGEKGLKAAMEAFAAFLVGTWLVKIVGAFSAVGGGWRALLTRLGIPIAIGLAASGGGNETPEQYRKSLESDPARAKEAADLNSRGGAGKRWWKRNMPTWLGGDPAGAAPDGAGGEAAPGRFSALKALIQSRESGSHSYNSVYGNGKHGWPEKKITEMTVREILAYQNLRRKQVGSPAFPVGRGQFVETTLRGLAKEHNAMDEKLTPELQEKFMDALIRRRGRSVQGLRNEWEGLIGVPADKILGAYDKDGSVKAPAPAKPSTPIPLLKAPPGGGITAEQFNERFGSAAPMGSGSISNSSADNRRFDIQHKTEIRIDGSGDPSRTANTIRESLGRQNELSLRNATMNYR